MNTDVLNCLNISFLTDQQKNVIHELTLDLFENCGVYVENDEAKELLYSAGATVSSNNLVKIPGHVVEKSLDTAPKKIEIFDRDGKPFMLLEDSNLYFGSNSEDIQIMEPFSGVIRKFQESDRLLLTKIIDALPNMKFAMTGGLAADVDPFIADRLSFTGTVKYTKKPIVFCATSDLESCEDMIEAAEIIAGGEKELREKPFIMGFADPISPLRNTNIGLSNLLKCAEKQIPVIYMPYLLLGGTAPVTMMGALIQSNAEVLGGLVVSQLKREGAPFIYGSMPAPMDMRTTIGTYGCPEFNMLIAAASEISHYYKLPFYGTAGTTDAYWMDDQATMEATMSVLMTAFSKANMAHDVGLMYHGTIISPYLLVLFDEMINMVRPMRRGIKMDKEQIALEVIKNVGPGGQYVSEEHTFKYFRDFWYPEMLDRTMTGGDKPLKEKINSKLEKIIKTHELPVLDEEMLREIEKLEEKWRSIL